ncbi:hypothetical protein [Maridesulfovibrio hydrothermalis]|uniref:Uncharacterized protein n=1 Tax=Maridesulfovibrio hydrothermalis AM13 = DSM 14728 TaxID=1121451 RepID=L0RGJ2_9BACT|nr:hypothetical protein [Maridesulfovibrio hydrothermalis]CCO25335.1 conserved protein of unknown function [Maridesulfovibrio hydrothermalis AM13 = DSM 14728]
MMQSKVDTRFLGTIQNSFYGIPNLPEPVKQFFMFLGIGLTVLIISYFIRKYGVINLMTSGVKESVRSLFSKKKKTAKPKKNSKTPWKALTDQDILERLVMTRAELDISGERSGQRTLAAIANVAGTENIDVVVTFKDLVTESLLIPGAKVKCIFAEMLKDSKKVNAFVGIVKSYTKDKGAVITRTSSFGYIKRRVFARRKVADQRYIKIKIWRLEDENFDIDFLLDKAEPDILIDNRKNVGAVMKVPQIIDISKGGIALYGSVREGGNMVSRNDKILLCMLIYMPKRKTFQPHLIYAEVRAAKSAGNGMSRLSFQFLRSLKIPARKRSTLFKGQSVMAMNLAQNEKN